MTIPFSIETFHFAGKTVKACIPTIKWLQQQLEKKEECSVPYWAQVWPAAKALCQVLALEPQLVKNKIVLELAAGLGLPSLLAAQFAKQVTATDYIEEAVEMMKRSVTCNKLNNIQCSTLDWNQPGKNSAAEVLLLSDINYNPVEFDQLYKVLTSYLQQGTTVVLSTPQRLMAKPFMDLLLPFKKAGHTKEIKHHNEIAIISVWILSF